ncbi:MAG: type II toxin-antitoxin system HicA family toxin [Candidatus Omnitrophota bacterium]|jgi:hypothetical protein|nr:MAG: type II toxin-antitoxin system HicA family toxin [Candidatus Omnitrophota bacterium]
MKRHQCTFKQIFEIPTRSDIKWSDVVSLIRHLGGSIKYGSGSRVRVILRDQSIVIHTPHPRKELKKYAVVMLRDLLEESGERL